MDRSGWNEEDVAHLERDRRLPLDLILERALEDINDFFARMGVLAEGDSRSKVDAPLDGLASGDAEIVLLQVGPLDSGLLSRGSVRRQNGSGYKRRQRHDLHLHLSIAHVEFLCVGWEAYTRSR